MVEVAIFSMPISRNDWFEGFQKLDLEFPKTILFSSTGIYPKEDETYTEKEANNLRPDILAAENLVIRRQGKGTFVATHHEARAEFRFLRLLPDVGDAHVGKTRIIEVKRLRGSAEVARLLETKPSDSLIFIKRVLSFDGAATILEEIWLPGTPFKGLTAERLNDYEGPMYGLFETEFGTRMIRATERIRAVAAEFSTADLLGVEVGSPLLSVERVAYTYGDKPVEVRRGLYRTEHHHYQNELN